MTFRDKLETIIAKNNSLLCVGLDPDLEKLPKHLLETKDPIFEFNKAIIDATHDLVCVYKPNIAFYEAEGIEGLQSLKKTIEYLQQTYPEIPLLLDAKRGDIGNTAAKYAKAAFEYWNADATTVYPHLGLDSLIPFFEYKDKMTIVLVKTSNKDSGMFQDLPVDGEPYYLRMAEKIKTWSYDNIGIFVGATYPKEMKGIRQLFPDHIFLSAGLGAQQAEIAAIVKAGINARGSGIMFNASRSILYASSGSDFADKARTKTLETRDAINQYRKKS
ncbi:MAG: orotidine-5'-phosphate decarboxylase [bacterium]|nr:orotidine-5'-phosphate decarboxylase [bacterium]